MLLGNGDGTFQTPVKFSAGARIYAWALVVGDFNGDAKPDVAVTSATVDLPGGRGVSVLLNTCAAEGVHLNLERSNDSLTLSWPLASADFVLESTERINSAIWQRSAEVPATNNSRCEVIVPLGQGQCYFRLRKP